MSVGIDIVKISRLQKFPIEQFAKKILSDAEQKLASANNLESLAATFAAKEAFSKAIGTGVRGFELKDVSVMRNSLGKPYLVFSPKLQSKLDAMGAMSTDVSLTHEKEYALAVVTIECDAKRKMYETIMHKFDECDTSHVITPDMIRDILPSRKKDVHKGSCGRCFVIAGSLGLTGAAILASKACVRCGAGLVTLGCPSQLNNIFEIANAEVMTLPLKDEHGVLTAQDMPKILDFAAKSDCILFGPGLTQSDAVGDILSNLISEYDKTLVIDADGINVLSKNINVLREHKADIILTPHLGEFARLTKADISDVSANCEEYASRFSTEYGVTLVLKSHKTVVALPDGRCYANMLGNPGMATGGSGDVLAGAIASFAAQGFGAQGAALLGVYIHSLAADMASLDVGEYGLTPTDICSFLPYAVKYSI